MVSIAKVKTREGRVLVLLQATSCRFQDNLEAKNLQFRSFESFYNKRTFGLGYFLF